MDNRGTLHYAADVSEAVGQLVGPNGFGEMLVVDDVEWDGHRSTARLRNATAGDLPPRVSAPALTTTQVRGIVHTRFWQAKAERDRMTRALTERGAREAAKRDKRAVRDDRGGLSKRQYDRLRKAANA